MTGEQVKQTLQRNGYTLNDIGRRLGESSQNFSAALKVQDIKTGMLERIAVAIDKPVTFFFGDNPQDATANGNTYNNSLMSLLAQKDEQLARAQAQIDRLLSIIESTINK